MNTVTNTIVGDEDLALLVNGRPHHVGRDCTVDDLVRGLGLELRRIAVAVNRDVVPRSAFRSHRLCTGDRVEILEAVGGG